MMTATPENTPLGGRLLILGAALLASFLFSAIEFAVIRLDRLKLKTEADEGDRTARLLLFFLDDTGRFLSSISIGNTLANLLLSSFVAVTFAEPLSKHLHAMLPGSNYASVEAATTAAVTLLLTFVVLVCGEIAPKQFALSRGDSFARRLARPIRSWAALVYPAVYCINLATKGLLRLFGVHPEAGQPLVVNEEQILRQVEYGEQHGAIESDEKEMIENVFDLNDQTAADVMVHRKDVVALPSDVSAREVADTIRETGYSRFPVYEENIDNVVGILNTRDFLLRSLQESEPAIQPLLRKAMFVPETIKADVLLKRMQKRKQRLAIVVDDFGGTSGIVSMEDLVEQIVGELYDEYDDQSDISRIVRLPDGAWRVPGESTIDDVNDTLDTGLVEGEFNTLGGYIIERLDTVPAAGALVRVPELGLELKVEKVDGHRIDSVLVRRVKPRPSETPSSRTTP